MKIGLTYTGSPEKHQYYIDWLKGNENVEVVRLSADDKNLEEIRNIDALVLSGGRDIHPKYYSSNKSDYSNAPDAFDERRDEFEMNAFKLARENNLPVLGICRGLQLINVVLNGTLIQDLGEESLNQIHKGNPDKLHPVHIGKETLLYNVTDTESGDINSAHHQAINQLGDGLIINSRADDGTIEGIEWLDKTGKPFMLAVQWHPERMFKFQLQDSNLSKTLRDRFIEEIKRSKSKKNS